MVHIGPNRREAAGNLAVALPCRFTHAGVTIHVSWEIANDWTAPRCESRPPLERLLKYYVDMNKPNVIKYNPPHRQGNGRWTYRGATLTLVTTQGNPPVVVTFFRHG